MPIDYSQYVDIDPAVLKREQELNQELGFVVPDDQASQADEWDGLFRLLRQMYAAGHITKEQSDKAYQYFYEQDTEGREGIMSRLVELKRTHEREVDLVKAMFTQDELKAELDDIASRLPPEIRRQFLYYIATGEEMPVQVQRAAESQVSSDELAKDKLRKLLSGDLEIDSTVIEGQPKALSPSDLMKKFNVQADFKTKPKPVENSKDKKDAPE